MLALTASDTRRALPVRECIAATREASIALSRGEIEVLERMTFPAGSGTQVLMPAAWPSRGSLTTKVIGIHPDNPARGLPTAQGLLALQELDTGRTVAVFEAGTLTTLRTGALCALAADALWEGERPIVALFGSGAQARAQLEALCAVRHPLEVRVVSRRTEHAHRFAKDMVVQAFAAGVPIRVLDSWRDAIPDADIVLCATSSPTPVFEGAGLRAGAHVSAVGAFTPTTREVDEDVVRRARIVVDTQEGARSEAGDLLIPLAKGLIDSSCFDTELGEVLSGAKRGRHTPDEITLFKSVGSAAFDVAAAAMAYAKARERGIGVEIDLLGGR